MTYETTHQGTTYRATIKKGSVAVYRLSRGGVNVALHQADRGFAEEVAHGRIVDGRIESDADLPDEVWVGLEAQF